MEHITASAIVLSGNPRSGVIYESGITNGYAYTLISYDADVHQVTVVYSNGTARTLDASRLGDTLLMWAALCHQCRVGVWPDMRLGSVGERLADRYAQRLAA
ncbi:hypothetical protein [Deinococcus sp. QL22]|uniref:hypothetical protein n=1 Tax=Deinococcus sp. QL22 TaxID=2939437 RepID=UPI002017442B|nr:hypothetical protein [Deinococcus sp. QL22]UQN10831.1 hypothetical protein M1R55_31680 [Deinococcus sp. QL22]